MMLLNIIYIYLKQLILLVVVLYVKEKDIQEKKNIRIMNENKEYYFVYGTLKRGYGNNRILSQSKTAKFVEEGITEPKFSLYNLGFFPGVKNNGTTSIHGEIWEVSDNETKQRLDMLEGYNKNNPNEGLYNKQKIIVNNKEVNIYILNRDVNENNKITTGIWD